MSELKYVWFDWEDNTTSVNTINIIKEPRKPLDEYRPGEEIKAKLPNFGTRLWNGVIVEIGDSKKELIAEMDRRQKLQALELSYGNKKDGNCQQEAAQKTSSDPACTVTVGGEDSGDAVEQQSQAKPEQTEGERKKKTKKRTPDNNDNEKQAEKKRKMELEKKKVEAASLQFKEIIENRRQSASESHTIQGETREDRERESACAVIQPPEPCQTDFHRGFNDIQTDSMAFYQQPQWGFSGFSPYRPSPYKYQQMRTHREEVEELKLKISVLQAENDSLKHELQCLKEKENRTFRFSDKVAVSPDKIEFLRHLASCLEETNEPGATSSAGIPAMPSLPVRSTESQGPCLEITPVRLQPIRPKPIRPLPFTESSVSETEVYEDQHIFVNQDMCSPEPVPSQSCSEAEVPKWEEPETENGKQKIRLVPDYDVFLLPAQLSEAVLKGADKPSLLIIALLEVFFSYEVLAVSKAKGVRSAHNKKNDGDTQPLPTEVINAIKSFTLKQFKKGNGTPCMSDKEMTDVINNKCGTARRSLQQAQKIRKTC